MTSYQPPLPDIQFVLQNLIGVETISGLASFEAINADLVTSILDGAGQIASEQFAPLNAIGDKAGATFHNGEVRMPNGFRKAWDNYIEGGWNALAVAEQHGGQGLPFCLAMPVNEMLQSANLALALCGLLNQGAIEALSVHGSEELKGRFLPKLVSGAWSGTMNLTEPQAGSDVGAVTTKAMLDEGSSFERYRISGQKIFISYGEHDLSENILHLVLARLPEAPPGTKGLSLFLVPKYLVTEDGSLGERNDVRAVSIEHKLGQHASPTCVMAYGDQGGAIGYLVGDLHGGMAAMFTMMNNARIGVGIQGLALMERSYQQAVEIARTRVQGKAIGKPKGPSVPIIIHADVRRMLLWMRAHTEAGRALALMTAFSADQARAAGNAPEGRPHAARVDLLTPVVKGWLTDLSNEITSIGVQVAGGMGYIEETGMAQHMRDARVLAIYEGTNGIQANDLLFRKILRDDGAALRDFSDEMMRFLPELADLPGDDAAVMHKHLARALSALRDAATTLLTMLREDPVLASASASPFLRLMGTVAGGYYLIRSAAIAQRLMSEQSGDPSFYSAKIVTARFYAEQVLSSAGGLATSVTEGPATVLAAPPEMF